MTFPGEENRDASTAACDEPLSAVLQERAERILGHLSFATGRCQPQLFFSSMAIDLCSSLQVRYALAAHLAETEPPVMESLAFVQDGRLQEPVRYALRGSPCEDVVGRVPCVYPSDVQSRFPNDRFIRDQGIQAYIAVPLADTHGEHLGLLAVLHDEPMDSEVAALCRTVLEIASMASSVRLAHAAQAKELVQMSEERMRLMSSGLTHVERWASMGQMLAGLAHEISQPLTAIAGFAEAAQFRIRESFPDEQLAHWIEGIMDAGRQTNEIIQRFRAFLRRETDHRTLVSLDETVRTCVQLLGFETRRAGIRMELDLGAGTPVQGDMVQLQQVVVNLLRNAMDAVSSRDRSDRHIRVTVRQEPSDVVLAVSDNGGGVHPHMVPHLFQPFQTRKPDGLGIGLAVSRSIIESHGGRITYGPQPSGAIFQIHLPSPPQRAPVRGDLTPRL